MTREVEQSNFWVFLWCIILFMGVENWKKIKVEFKNGIEEYPPIGILDIYMGVESRRLQKIDEIPSEEKLGVNSFWDGTRIDTPNWK